MPVDWVSHASSHCRRLPQVAGRVAYGRYEFLVDVLFGLLGSRC